MPDTGDNLNILFICAGNIMRSVISECLLQARARELLGPHADLMTSESCGLEAEQDALPHGDAVMALEYLGVPMLETTAARADEYHMRRCDLAITMTRQQSYILANRFPELMRKYFSMMEVNGAIETLLEIKGVKLDDRDWAEGARSLERGELLSGLKLAAGALQNAERVAMRPIAGVPLNIVELLTLFSPCFHQVSGVHDPIGGTAEETYKCASILDEQVTLLLNGLLALALTEL